MYNQQIKNWLCKKLKIALSNESGLQKYNAKTACRNFDNNVDAKVKLELKLINIFHFLKKK